MARLRRHRPFTSSGNTRMTRPPDTDTPTGARRIRLAGEAAILLPERALYLPERRTLLAADLHWGKDEAFRQSGIGLPGGVLAADLDRLAASARRTGARTVYILGDLIHSRAGLRGETVTTVAARRDRLPDDLRLIPGNHDRHARALPAEWRIRVEPDVVGCGPFRLAHAAPAGSGAYALGGHVHPTVRFGGRADRFRLPCFCFGGDSGVLPAFSEFTGGQNQRPATGRTLYPVGHGRVWDGISE